MGSTASVGTVDCNRIRARVASWSWEQPPGIGIGGWEGRCGQTCVANLLMNSEPSRRVSPQHVISMGGDLGPGSHPETLLRFVRTLAGSRRQYRLCTQDPGALTRVTPARPIGCLLQWDAGVLHWVTVVDADVRSVVFNHWGRQESLARFEFTQRWGFRNQRIVDSAITSVGGLAPFTALV